MLGQFTSETRVPTARSSGPQLPANCLYMASMCGVGAALGDMRCFAATKWCIETCQDSTTTAHENAYYAAYKAPEKRHRAAGY